MRTAVVAAVAVLASAAAGYLAGGALAGDGEGGLAPAAEPVRAAARAVPQAVAGPQAPALRTSRSGGGGDRSRPPAARGGGGEIIEG